MASDPPADPAPAAPARRAHFNHAGASIPDPSVTERMIGHLRREAEIGGYEAAEEVADELVSGRAALGAVIGASGDDVVVVESATRAFETIVWALALSHRWRPDQRVVVDPFAYVSNWAVLVRLREALGVDTVVAPAGPDGALDAGRLAEVVDASTVLVLVTHIPTHVGTVTDLEAAVDALAELDAQPIVALDISQSLGQLVVDVGALGAAVAFAPGRKFLRAPRGTGLLYVAADLAETVRPLGLDLTATTAISSQGIEPAPGARRFDLFEHDVAARLGLGQACRHLLAQGPGQVADQVAQRSAQVVDLVASTPGLALVAPGPVRGIVSFTHPRLDPTEVRARLAAAGVNAWTNVANGSPLDGERRGLGPSVRLSPHATTTDDDLGRLARALSDLG